MAKYKEGDKVVVTKLVSADYERGIRVRHIAKVITVRDIDGAAYCHNPKWDYRDLQRQSRTMLSYQIEKCEVNK